MPRSEKEHAPTSPSRPHDNEPASAILRGIAAKAAHASGERITLGALLEGTGPRVYGLALIVFALPEAIPFPAAGLAGLIALPLIALSLTMIVGGMQGELPFWLRKVRIKRRWVIKLCLAGARQVERIERFSYPRWATWAESGRPLGVMCIGLSAVMFIPIPYTNVAPGVTVLAIGLGVLQRDGALVLASCAVGLIIISVLTVLGFFAGRLLL